MEFVQIAEEEGEEPIELPTEEDGTLLQSTLQAQYPGSCGLKYRNEDTKAVRGVRLSEGRFFPPTSTEGWGDQIYFCVFPKENKRKSDDNLENSIAKTKRVESGVARCPDLIVLGLSWETTEKDLREHFEEFGEVLMAQLKKDMETGKSKGFGFVRFADYDAQKRVLNARHLINGRLCEVKLPNSKRGLIHQASCKVYVGRLTEQTTTEDLREYFSKFGEVTDVFIPRPFRAFSFVSFLDPDVAQSLCGEDHIIKGVSVHVSSAAPKIDKHNNGNNGNYGGNNFNRYGGNNMAQNGRGNHNNGYGNNRNGVIGSGLGGGGGHGNSNGGGMIGNGGMGGFGGGSSYSSSNRQDNGMQGYNNQQQQRSGIWNNQSRGNLDMPNLQSLGINPQGQNSSNQSQNLSNPLGVGLDLNQLSMNPAIVAAALNQFMSNLQNQSQDQVKTK